MADQWIIRVLGKDYGPADLATLHEWKADGRVLPTNPARRVDVDLWETAAEIPGLFQIEPPPVQVQARDQRPEVRHQTNVETRAPGAIAADPAAATTSRPPSWNILVESFRIYFRGFFQFLALTLLTLVPSLSSQFASAMIQTAPNVNVDLRTMATAAFSVCMFVLTLVLWPVYVAGIQVLSAELSAGHRVSFLSILNHAVKYWPRVAGLCIFVYVVFGLLILFAFGILIMVATSSGLFSVVLALGLLVVQVWLFAGFFIRVLFWQQFAVLGNLNAFDAVRESRNLARSGGDLPRFQRPMWRGAIIVSLWYAFVIGLSLAVLWPRFVAEWPIVQDYFNQLTQTQDPLAVLQKFSASLQSSQALQGIDYRALGLNIAERILQPLLGIAFVVLYLDSKGQD